MLKFGHWTTAGVFFFLMKSMVWPQEGLANPDRDVMTTQGNDDFSVASLTDKPSIAGFHDADQQRIPHGESELDQVIADVSNPSSVIAPDRAADSVGRITVNTRSAHQRVGSR